MTLDFTFERQLELTARDEREAGRLEGIQEGKKEQSILTEKERKRADEAEAEVKRLREELEKYKAGAKS